MIDKKVIAFFVLIFSFTLASFSSATLEHGLVAHYKLDGNTNDATGSNNGENIGVEFAEGRTGSAGIFQQEDYVRVANSNSLQMDKEFTISAWIKDSGDNTDGDYATIAGKWDNPYEYFFGLHEGEKKLVFGVQDGGYFPRSTKIIENDVWTFVAVTFKENTNEYKFYVDDELAGSGTLSKNLVRSTSKFNLGRAAGGNSWIGQLDDVRVWDRVLNGEEIMELYNSYQSGNGQTCQDNDGGINYQIYGEVKICNQNSQGGSCGIIQDICQNGNLIENFCDGTNADSESYKCPYGCSDGACLPETTGQTCVDTDGGIDFYERGVLTSCYGEECTNQTDVCLGDDNFGEDTLTENYCLENGYGSSWYHCAFGCNNGACVEPNQSVAVCNDLINEIVYPENFEINGIHFTFGSGNSWRNTYYIDGQEEEATGYYSGWHAYHDGEWNYLGYEINIFDNPDVGLQEWLNQEVTWRICNVDYYLEGHPIYICNWDILYGRQDTEYQDDSRELIWFNDNVLVRINTYQGRQLTDEEMNRVANEIIVDFLDNLRNNEGAYVDWENFAIEYPLYLRVYDALSKCQSDVAPPTDDEGNTCYPSWECITEPVICPPHGYQTKRCVDYSCGRTIENQIQCSPGLCSGCYVPRWAGYNNGDNICVPYGIRLARENIDDRERLNEGTTSEDTVTFTLEVISKYEATLSIMDTSGFSRFYNLYQGQTVEIEYPETIGVGSVTIRIDDIAVGDEGQENGYIEFSVISVENAYCDIDGNIKRQKEKLSDGSWASCQNNYECGSNLCSGGQCVEINDGISQIGKMRGLFMRVLCRLANVFNNEDYDACIAEYIGELPEGTLQSPA